MVIFSNEIQDVLSELYFSEFATNVNTPRYYALKRKLLNLDKSYINRMQGRYPAWRDMYEIQMECSIFGYSWDGQTACVEECFKEKVKEYINNVMNTNKKVIRLTESDLRTIIKGVVKEALNELDARTYASAADKAFDRNFNDNRVGKFRKAAVDAWNRDYGEYIHPWDNDGKVKDNNMDYYDGYIVSTYEGGEDGENVTYHPYGNRISGIEKGSNEYIIDKKAKAKDFKNHKGWKVAQEMHLGNGKYIPGKGWK